VSGNLVYTPTEKHLIAAYQRHWPTGLNWKLLLFLALLSLAMGFMLARPGPFRLQDIASISLGGMVGGAVAAAIIQWLVAKIWIPHFARRVYRQQADLKRETRIEWSEAGFRAISNSGESTDPWSTFFQWKRSADMLLLYRSEALFNFIPLDLPGGENAGDEIVGYLQVAGVKEKRA
jgi:YcxB-like protein